MFPNINQNIYFIRFNSFYYAGYQKTFFDYSNMLIFFVCSCIYFFNLNIYRDEYLLSLLILSNSFLYCGDSLFIASISQIIPSFINRHRYLFLKIHVNRTHNHVQTQNLFLTWRGHDHWRNLAWLLELQKYNWTLWKNKFYLCYIKYVVCNC